MESRPIRGVSTPAAEIRPGIVLLAAFAPELEAAPRALPRALVGVGLVSSALGAARLLADRKPSAAILLGTCGAYAGSGLSIGDVVVAERTCLADAGQAESRAAILLPMREPVELDRALREKLGAGARLVSVATTLAVTTDDALAESLARSSGCAVEHLEAYAVARAFADAAVPLAIVLGVANDVGSRGREQWAANHRSAAAAAVRHALTSLSLTADG